MAVALLPAQGAVLDCILDGVSRRTGLTRLAASRLHTALTKTPWGRRCYRRVALVDGDDLLASAVHYRLQATLDGQSVTACGIGSLNVEPPHQPDHARHLLDALLEQAEQDGSAIGVLFPQTACPSASLEPFKAIPVPDLTLAVAEPTRYGAPMTMVRAGEERDL